jgi:hypothetical protein
MGGWRTGWNAGLSHAASRITKALSATLLVVGMLAGLGVLAGAAAGAATTAPTPPQAASATAGSGSAGVSWSAPSSTGGSPITGYTVTSQPGGLTATASGTSTWVNVPGLTNGVAYTFTVTATNAVGTSAASSATNSVTPGVGTSAKTPSLAGAGDISCLASNPLYNGSNPDDCQMDATASLVRAMSPAPTVVLPLGDNQEYPSGGQASVSDWTGAWAQSSNWGGLTTSGYTLHPATGNDDYSEDTNNGGAPGETAPGFFGFFNGQNGEPNGNPTGDTVGGQPAGWYSYNIGSWHLIALNTDCNAIGGCAAGDPQEQWLASDLAADQSACTLAYWEEPFYSSNGGESQYQAIWNDLSAYHADVVLNAHQHIYERFLPQNASGVQTSTGITEIDDGVGGQSTQGGTLSPAPNSAVIDTSDFGVIEMSLSESSYSWQFDTVNHGVVDSGSRSCNNAPASPNAPTVSALSPVSGPSTGGTSVTITGTNLTGATAVDFGSTPAKSFSVTSATSITAVSPAATSSVDVTVTTPSGTSAVSAADEFTDTFALNGYSVSLTASTTSPAVGGSVTLTATANQDVGPTPYGLYIYDVTTGSVVGHVSSGTSTSATVSQSAATTQRYVAYIANTGPTNAQAGSAPAVVTWSGSPPASSAERSDGQRAEPGVGALDGRDLGHHHRDQPHRGHGGGLRPTPPRRLLVTPQHLGDLMPWSSRPTPRASRPRRSRGAGWAPGPEPRTTPATAATTSRSGPAP